MKILFIGNSFGDDACAHLYGILSSLGARDAVAANLYIGGCSLARHAENVLSGAPAYEYRKTTSGGLHNRPETSAVYALTDEHWDVVSLQQCSGLSGIAGSYNGDIDVILSAVRAHAGDAKIYWHMTWAYDDKSGHPEFYRYGNSRKQMFADITAAVSAVVAPDVRFSGIIPSGTAVENAREAGLSGLTRDGFHLSFGLGRYIAALCCAEALTGQTEKSRYSPKDYPVDSYERAVALSCVKAALKNPFSVSRALETPTL